MCVKFFRALLVLPLVIFVCLNAPGDLYAAKLAGIEFTDTAEVNGETLALNGLGLRTATFFKVKVYALALYLKETAAEPQMIIDSKGTKRIVMHFMREVSSKKLRDAWSAGFKKNYKNSATLKQHIDALNAVMPDMQKGNLMVFDFVEGQVQVTINGRLDATIYGEEFQKGLLSVWLGPAPPNEGLKRGILGG